MTYDYRSFEEARDPKEANHKVTYKDCVPGILNLRLSYMVIASHVSIKDHK